MTGTSTSKAVVSGEDLSSSQNQSSAIKTSTRAIIAHHASTGFAWLFVFLPALAYYVHHFVIFGGHVGYPVITSSIDVYNGQDGINIMKELLYIDESSADLEGSEIDTKTPRTKTPVQVLLTQHVEMVLDGFQSLAGPTWIHDDELGRGYLLFSDVGANRIWRWEVGGGPITIGRTLHMERSGCRSNRAICDDLPFVGSTGMTMEVGPPPDHVKHLVVGEQGERRIVRIESDGARTPLATHTTHGTRLNSPRGMVYSPMGDFIFTDPRGCDLAMLNLEQRENRTKCALPKMNDDGDKDDVADMGFAGVWRINEAVHLDPTLASQSRAAHYQQANTSMDLIYSKLGMPYGIDIASDSTSVLVSDADPYNLIIVKLSIETDDDGDKEEEDRNVSNVVGHEENREKANSEGKPNSIGVCANDLDVKDKTSCTSPFIIGEQDEASNVLFFDASSLFAKNKQVIGLAGLRTDSMGNVWVAGPEAVLVLSNVGKLLARISVGNDSSATGVTFGDDGYLYITTVASVLRVKTKAKGSVVPNLVTKRFRRV